MSVLWAFIEKLVYMTAWKMTPPPMYGMFHILVILFGGFGTVFLAYKIRNCSDRKLTVILCVSGVFLLLMEGYKQLFYYLVIHDHMYAWFYFPFQLCSVPMYLCTVYPLLKNKGRETIRTFLGTFTLLGTVCALIFPEAMLKEYWTLTIHGFLWHLILLFLSVLCFLRREKSPFMPAVRTFLGLSFIAALINYFGDRHISIPNDYPDMFYISCTHYTGQPVFSTLQHLLGIPAGKAVYLCAIIAVAWILHVCGNKRFH